MPPNASSVPSLSDGHLTNTSTLTPSPASHSMTLTHFLVLLYHRGYPRTTQMSSHSFTSPDIEDNLTFMAFTQEAAAVNKVATRLLRRLDRAVGARARPNWRTRGEQRQFCCELVDVVVPGIYWPVGPTKLHADGYRAFCATTPPT
jgi:hypothetical protein